ncbi:hypothetical protein LIA77_01666 [Sarocladium implicatum]|nr:hypothetical protein LIA77_01666 [Sarocladium implicatum]
MYEYPSDRSSLSTIFHSGQTCQLFAGLLKIIAKIAKIPVHGGLAVGVWVAAEVQTQRLPSHEPVLPRTIKSLVTECSRSWRLRVKGQRMTIYDCLSTPWVGIELLDVLTGIALTCQSGFILVRRRTVSTSTQPSHLSACLLNCSAPIFPESLCRTWRSSWHRDRTPLHALQCLSGFLVRLCCKSQAVTVVFWLQVTASTDSAHRAGTSLSF